MVVITLLIVVITLFIVANQNPDWTFGCARTLLYFYFFAEEIQTPGPKDVLIFFITDLASSWVEYLP